MDPLSKKIFQVIAFPIATLIIGSIVINVFAFLGGITLGLSELVAYFLYIFLTPGSFVADAYTKHIGADPKTHFISILIMLVVQVIYINTIMILVNKYKKSPKP